MGGEWKLGRNQAEGGTRGHKPGNKGADGNEIARQAALFGIGNAIGSPVGIPLRPVSSAGRGNLHNRRTAPFSTKKM